MRDFLVTTYQTVGKGYNWSIECWNFSYSLARMMNGLSVEEWEKQSESVKGMERLLQLPIRKGRQVVNLFPG
ncbi:MAG: hypothetical protein KAX49_17550 [Halanaerobiales bacterium]|nr:hypothetical protein [Halanaerobiales bacterium]